MPKLPFVFSILLAVISINIMQAKPLPLPNDTLILQTEKYAGYGLFSGGHWGLYLVEIDHLGERIKNVPEGISDLKLGRQTIDLKVDQYKSLKENQSDYLSSFLATNYPTKIDTAHLPAAAENAVEVIIGQKEGKQVFIVDENGNRDYRDDPIRHLSPMDSVMETTEPIKCHYQIYNGKELVRDSGWVFIGLNKNGQIRISVAQYLQSAFSLNGQDYVLQSISWIPFIGFCFDSPKISITAQNGIKKDSLLFSEELELGEYLKFGEAYYQFVGVANDGSTITLIKEEDVSDKIGTQAGFIAPDFAAVTTEGDSVALKDYRDQYLLLVNVTACWSKKMSYDYYKELSEKYNTKINLLTIDESPGILQSNIDYLGLEGKFIISTDNRSIKKTYREDYCSRVCFLIGPSGHIIDRFEIADWESSLAKHFQ